MCYLLPSKLGCYRTQQFSVVVVHTRTLPFFRTRTATAPTPALRHYENVLFKCLQNPEKFKKNFEIFFSTFFFNFFEVVII